MAYTTINKSTDHFNTKLYTGNNSTNAQTGVGFQPDWLWIKCRSHADSSQLVDALRGTNALRSDGTNAQSDIASNGFTSLDSDGFTLNGNGSGGNVNNSGRTYAAWNWKAGGTGSANTDGTINSTVSANTTAGFSIVKYTGNGLANSTVGHGLGAIPKMIIIKGLTNTSAENWRVFHNSVSNGRLVLNDNDEVSNSTDFGANGSGGTITQNINYFTIGDNARVNGSGDEFIAYCFAEKTGYSKFGSYTGNGSSSSPTFIYTGFKPKFVIVKCTNEADEWFMHDDKRDGYNDDNEYLFASVTNVEGTNTNRIRLLSNGFSVPTTDKSHNKSGNSYIYMAFGQSIVGSNNVPCTAR